MKKIVYKNNPLIQVIIQIMFPTIIELNTEDPITFRNLIKVDFPYYKLNLDNQQEIVFNPNDNNEMVPSVKNNNTVRNHTFVSKDGSYMVNLTNSFISLSTVAYEHWEKFSEKLTSILNIFNKIYDVPFYERIGLRYIDAYSKDLLNLTEYNWNQLINSPWIGAMIFDRDDDSYLNSSIDTEFKLNETSTAKIHAGLGTVNNTQKAFIIDSDFITISSIPFDDIDKKINYLHNEAKIFIESAILEPLKKAMIPEEIEL